METLVSNPEENIYVCRVISYADAGAADFSVFGAT